MPLTEIECRNIKPSEKTKRIFAENGLYLEITPNGSKYWRYKYRFARKEKRLALGVYPEISLKKARELRDEARVMLRNGIDPSAEKRALKQKLYENSENSFKSVAKEWMEKRKHLFTDSHNNNQLAIFELNIFPILGSTPINNITAPAVLFLLRKIESTGTIDKAHRIQRYIGQVLRYAIVTGRAERDVTADLRGAIQPAKRTGYAYLKEADLPELLKALEKHQGDIQTKIGIKLLLLTFVRTIELRGAKWTEIDFEKAEWRIPAERMKMREIHIVPLSKQVLALLRELNIITGNYEYLFPNRNNPAKFISSNTFLFALYRLGFQARTTGHGFRATASTILNEKGFRPDVIERQLAHVERNSVRRAYNYAQYLQERREMMQWWADYITSLTNEW